MILKSHIVMVLDAFEVVLTAWEHNIADREIIEREFARLLSPTDGRYPFEPLLSQSVVKDRYSLIERFDDRRKERTKKLSEGKAPAEKMP